MIYYKCDNCGTEKCGETDRAIKGYTRPHDGGILLVETSWEHHFCCRNCIVEWMAIAIQQETMNGFRLTEEMLKTKEKKE